MYKYCCAKVRAHNELRAAPGQTHSATGYTLALQGPNTPMHSSLLTTNHQDRPVPRPVRRSGTDKLCYVQCLPAMCEVWASARFTLPLHISLQQHTYGMTRLENAIGFCVMLGRIFVSVFPAVLFFPSMQDRV